MTEVGTRPREHGLLMAGERRGIAAHDGGDGVVALLGPVDAGAVPRPGGIRPGPIECTCTEREVGRCSRPTVRPGRNVNDERDHGDGSDTRPRGRRTSGSLTETRVCDWQYLPERFDGSADQNTNPCSLDGNAGSRWASRRRRSRRCSVCPPESYRTWDAGRRATPLKIPARARALATHRDDHANFRVCTDEEIALLNDADPGNNPPQSGCIYEDQALIRPDTTINYEAGVRRSWRDGRFSANGTLFHVDWEDIKVTGLTPFSSQPITLNGGGAVSRGVSRGPPA